MFNFNVIIPIAVNIRPIIKLTPGVHKQQPVIRVMFNYNKLILNQLKNQQMQDGVLQGNAGIFMKEIFI